MTCQIWNKSTISDQKLSSWIPAPGIELEVTSPLCPEDAAQPLAASLLTGRSKLCGNPTPLPQCFVFIWTLCVPPDNVSIPLPSKEVQCAAWCPSQRRGVTAGVRTRLRTPLRPCCYEFAGAMIVIRSDGCWQVFWLWKQPY